MVTNQYASKVLSSIEQDIFLSFFHYWCCERSFPLKADSDSQSPAPLQRLLYNGVFSSLIPPLPDSLHCVLHLPHLHFPSLCVFIGPSLVADSKIAAGTDKRFFLVCLWLGKTKPFGCHEYNIRPTAETSCKHVALEDPRTITLICRSSLHCL